MRKKLVSIVLLGSVLGNSTICSFNVFAEGSIDNISQSEIGDMEDVKEFKFSDKIVIKLNEIDTLVKKAENSNKVEDLDKGISAFMDIHELIVLDDTKAHKDGDKFDDLYLRIREMLYNLPNDIRNKKVIDFQQQICNRLKVKTWTFYNEYLYYTEDKNTIPEIQSELIKAIAEYNDALLPEKGEDNGLSEEADNDNGLIPDAPNMNDMNNQKPEQPDFLVEGKNVEYKAEGKNCYKVITYYVDGKVKSVNKEEAIKSEYVFCSIFDYVDFGGGNYNSNGGLYGNMYGSNWDYINQTQNPESNMTLQFTVEKDGEKPYYFDTGIRTALDETVSYEQFKDVIYQVAVKSKGYVVEDKNKILAVIEGKSLVFKNTKDKYTKSDIEKTFTGFAKVDVRIMETRIGKSESLEERIVGKQARKVKIDDREIELTANPIVKDNRALLPVEQVASELKAKVEKNEGTFLIIKDKTTIEYQEKKNILTINGNKKDTVTSPEYKDGYFMAEVQDMIDAFGYDMIWDGETSTILINKK